SVDVVKCNCDPASVRAAARQFEDFAARGKPASRHKAVSSNILKAFHVWLDASFEEVQVAISIEVTQAIEVAGSDLAARIALGKMIPITDQAAVITRFSTFGLHRIEIDDEVRAGVVREDKIQNQSRSAKKLVDARRDSCPAPLDVCKDFHGAIVKAG